jgi:hypothetical protein
MGDSGGNSKDQDAGPDSKGSAQEVSDRNRIQLGIGLEAICVTF